MSYVTPEALNWALETLRDWQKGLPKRFRQNLPRFLLLKELGVSTGEIADAGQLSSVDFTNSASRYLKVSYPQEEDGSCARTGDVPKYFVPFTGDYARTAPSDYAVGTLWTRCETWRNNGYIDFQELPSHARKIVFTPEYLKKLAEGLNGKKIPGTALSLFLLRRPSDSGVDATKIVDLSSLIELFKTRFGLTESEINTAFDFAPPSENLNWLNSQEMTRDQVLDTVLNVWPHPDVATDRPVETARLTVNWDTVEIETNPCGLRGQSIAFRQAIDALAAGKHVILLGPPGTGKTQLATCIAEKLDVPTHVVTATSDWTTFDTIGGYMPDPLLAVGESAREPLNFSPGVVVRSILTGSWLIIDEINRADIDKAFGELFTLLSGKPVRLPYSVRHGEELKQLILGADETASDEDEVVDVPPDWRIIGTMNSFDKASLFQLSFAFMRRFAFVEVPIPSREIYEEIINYEVMQNLAEWKEADRTACTDLLKRVFSNEDMGSLRNKNFSVGPAIPIDIVRHLSAPRRSDMAVRDAVLQTLEMYLYPQFEGRDRDHTAIRDAIASALELDQNVTGRTEQRLAIWTGFEREEG